MLTLVLYILGFLLIILFLVVFLLILGLMTVVGAVCGVVFIYVRSGVSYINSVREEVTNPVAKGLTMTAAGIVVFVPALVIVGFALAIILSAVGVI